MSQPSHDETLSQAFFSKPAPAVARALLGCVLSHDHPEGRATGIIVETEAYDQGDPASHSCRGLTPRNHVMFGPGGHAYVYRSYGLHWCVNVSCGPKGHGAAVLLRALQPCEGEALMLARRLRASRGTALGLAERINKRLACGPGNLCVALAIDQSHNGQNMRQGRLRLYRDKAYKRDEVITTTRIGISIAQEVPWRFLLADNRHVSKRAV